MDEKTLCKAALAAMKYAYAPYSGYTVGAALLTADGRVFPAATLKMPRSRRPSARSAPPFSKR